ncbi:MAG: hypothetical protein LQ340_001689 [Diploschistes diacapsis]|nr:MAG: hypothetical protein LQ340_001689 [Diploschistes diacapsis]
MPALDVQMSEVRTTFASNLYGVMLVNKTFIPLVLAARGALVHIGSVAGYMPYLFGSAYNASKAALHAYCNTLRIELAPFGVHVLTLITGGVKSNIARTERQLPEGSLYAPFDKQFRRRVTHSQEVTMKTSVYAEQAVKECENARGCLWSRNEVWMGSRVWQVWWGVHIDGFWPGGLWGLVMSKMFDIKSQIKSK